MRSAQSGGMGLCQDVLRCGLDLTDRTHLGFAIFLEVNGALYPCAQVWFVLTRDGAYHLSVSVPVDACKEVLMVLSVCQTGSSLCFGFSQKGSF